MGKTVSFLEYCVAVFYSVLPARVQFCMVFIPCGCILFVTWLEHRREPMEIFMDREVYMKDPDSYMYVCISTTTTSRTCCATVVPTNGATQARTLRSKVDTTEPY